MGKVAFVFPGQGSQYVGMGKEVAEQYPAAREVFETADRVLAQELTKACFDGPEERLKDTRQAQPGILTTSIALLSAVEVEGCRPDFVAGHSLGEYSALVAARAISLETAMQLVGERSRLMAEADPEARGAMAAVIGLSRETVLNCLKSVVGVEAANFNCPGQIVVSGLKSELVKVQEAVAAAGGKFMPLAVSGAFHSSFMKSAADTYLKTLQTTEWEELQVPLISNVDALPVGRTQLTEKLYRQMFSSVFWEDSLNYLSAQGVDTFIEIGPGKVLAGLIKKTLKGVTALSCGDMNSLKKALAILKEV